MNKSYIFSLLFFVLLTSCKKEKKQAPIKKIYVVEYGFDCPEPPATEWVFYVHGISEVDSMYNIVTTRCGASRGDYYSDTFTLADSTRTKISGIIDKYPRDTTFIFSWEEDPREYGGYYYFIWVERSDNARNLIDLYIPRNIPSELKYVYRSLYENHKLKKSGSIIINTDSLQNSLSRFEKYLPKDHISKPPAISWDNMPVFTIPDSEDTEEEEYEEE